MKQMAPLLQSKMLFEIASAFTRVCKANFFQNNSLQLIYFFALMQRSNKKNQGKKNWLRLFLPARPLQYNWRVSDRMRDFCRWFDRTIACKYLRTHISTYVEASVEKYTLSYNSVLPF